MRGASRIRRWAGVALVAWIASCARSPGARAEGLALERFHAAPAGDRFLGLPSPYVAGHLDLHAMLLTDYAYNPLVLKLASTKEPISTLVAHQAIVHVNASFAIAHRLLVNVDVPAVALQAGDADPSLHAADFGDLRLGLRARLFGDDGTPFQLGLGGYFWAPTGTGSYVSDHAIRGMPYLVAGGLAGQFIWTFLFGSELRFAQTYRDRVPQGTSIDAGLGLAFVLGRCRSVQIGAEVSSSFLAARPESRSTGAELLLHGRHRFLRRFEVGAGFGGGFGSGLGTPTFRAVGFFAYVPVARLQPEPAPPEDCDALARLRPEPETPLPADTEPLPPVPEARVRVVDDEVVFTGDLPFAPGSTEPAPSSEPVIREIAEFLNIHPELRRLEVRGEAEIDRNLKVDERFALPRAEAVRAALIRHGVHPGRLVAKSHVPSNPSVSNTTSGGRAKSRRVEIRILERVDLRPLN